MDDPFTLHLLGPPGPARDGLAEALSELDPLSHETPEAIRGEAGEEERCVVVATSELAAGTVLALAREIADGPREWILLRAEERAEGGATLRPVSAGFGFAPDELAERLAAEEPEDHPVFDLHEVLRFVARVRHDVNNPLTAGLAETQLLLMDVDEDGELRQSLETIQRQLRRIQELVQDLTRLRRPGRRVG